MRQAPRDHTVGTASHAKRPFRSRTPSCWLYCVETAWKEQTEAEGDKPQPLGPRCSRFTHDGGTRQQAAAARSHFTRERSLVRNQPRPWSHPVEPASSKHDFRSTESPDAQRRPEAGVAAFTPGLGVERLGVSSAVVLAEATPVVTVVALRIWFELGRAVDLIPGEIDVDLLLIGVDGRNARPSQR
jgi:hypothetical protein